MPALHAACSRCAWAMLALALAIVVLLVIGPRTGAYRTLTILSGSMEPRFGAGDMIITTPAPTSSVRVGDVITYEAPVAGRPTVTHRVVRVVRPGTQPIVVTRGDANAADDPWQARLTSSRIWRQQVVIPHAGHVVRLLRRDLLHELLLYGLPGLFVVLVLVDTWRPSAPPTRTGEIGAEGELLPSDPWLDDPGYDGPFVEWLEELEAEGAADARWSARLDEALAA